MQNKYGTIYITTNIASFARCMWNMVSFIKWSTQAKRIWKQDPVTNIWVQWEENGEYKRLLNEELNSL